jgi:uncharacterized cupin superfamily protein
MDYEIVNEDDVPVTDLSEVEGVPPDLNIQAIDDALGTENVGIKLWHFEPGEEIQYHAHSEQEELYYALEGEFSVRLGKSGEDEIHEVGPGTFWVAKPKIGHGHRYIGDDTGVVLAIGAPRVEDPGLDPHSLDE